MAVMNATASAVALLAAALLLLVNQSEARPWWAYYQCPKGVSCVTDGATNVNPMKNFKVNPRSIDKVSYDNGYIMSQPINIYITWYGNWLKTDKDFILNFLDSLAQPKTGTVIQPSPSLIGWWKILSQYAGPQGPVSSLIRVHKKYQFTDSGSKGPSLTLAQVEEIITRAIMPATGRGKRYLPGDPWGIYLFLSAKDVEVEGFCTENCGLHDKMRNPKWQNTGLSYGVVAYPTTNCLALCSPFAGAKAVQAPNDPLLDSFVNSIAHEVAELATNNDKFGYAAAKTLEIGDLCNYDYGSTMTNANNQTYNLHGNNGAVYLIQRIWAKSTNNCQLQG